MPPMPANPIQPRPRQTTPETLIADTLDQIRNAFYPASFTDPKTRLRWFQDRPFLLKNFVLYPAAWLNERALTMPLDRIRAILATVISQVKTHGANRPGTYYPAYLLRALQDHLAFNADELAAESKSIQYQVASVLTSLPRTQPDPVPILLAARNALRSASKKRPCKSHAPSQQTLF